MLYRVHIAERHTSISRIYDPEPYHFVHNKLSSKFDFECAVHVSVCVDMRMRAYMDCQNVVVC